MSGQTKTRSGLVCLACFLTLLTCCPCADAQSLKLCWTKLFANPVTWYVRTSAGVIVAGTGKGLVAIDEVEGNQLWMLPVMHRTGKWQGTANAAALRGQDIVEVPGMGVLLLNHAKLQGDTDGRLIALNLMTGKRLWDQHEVDELMTAVPLYDTGDAVLVSRRRQKKIYVAEEAALAVSGLPGAAYYPVFYPFRFELTRIDLSSGKAKWNTEYERTFTSGSSSVHRFGGQLFIYFGNRVMTAINLEDGKFLWEDGKKHFGNAAMPLPVAKVNGRLIYSTDLFHAVDPATQHEEWRMEELGKVTGIVHRDAFVVALGDRNIAEADAATGKELWRNQTHGHTSNLLWDRTSDALIYLDGKGLHRIDAATGKTLMDTRVDVESWPSHIHLASPDVVVTFAVKELCAYDVRAGKKLFSEGRLKAFFSPDSALNNWPMPEDGERIDEINRIPAEDGEWAGLKRTTLLPPEVVRSLEARAQSKAGFLEAFVTEVEGFKPDGTVAVARKVWWIDPKTNRQVEISPSGEHHDVDRRAGMVFAVNGIQFWGARIAD